MTSDRVARWTRRIDPSNIRAAAWAAVSLRRSRRALRERGVAGRIPFPPPLPDAAVRGVLAVLRRTEPTCLERATVLQTWLAAHHRPVQIVVGVTTDRGDVKAHAWIEPGAADAETAKYRVIHRIPPPVPPGSAIDERRADA